MQIKWSTNALAISIAVAYFKGSAREYLVKRSCIVRIYVLPVRVSGSEPIMSIEILSNAAHGVSVIIIGCRVFTCTSFFN